MAKQSKIGVCENCGDKGALTGSFGRQVCSTCLKIRSNVNSHLPKIANAARSLGKGEELIKALIPDGGSLAVQVTATLLQEISGIVGYEGEDPAELVEAVRRRALAAAVPAERSDLDQQWIDLMRASGLEDDGGRKDWSWAAAAAVQTIANLNERNRLLHNHVGLGESQLAKLRAELTLAEQARDEWEQRSVHAEANVETLEAELRNREDEPAVPCADNTYLLDIALRALRGEGPDAGQLAMLLDAARRAA